MNKDEVNGDDAKSRRVAHTHLLVSIVNAIATVARAVAEWWQWLEQ